MPNHDYPIFDASTPPHVSAVLRDSVEVGLYSGDDFLKVKETLTRMGVASRQQRVLYQSCHILHKQGKYYIISFKELFLLDGKSARTSFTEDDRARRNTIANLLAEWKLVKLVDPTKSASPVVPVSTITVLPFREKAQWKLIAKYDIGKKREHSDGLV